MSAMSVDMIVLSVLFGLVFLLLAHWVHASRGLGLNMLREWLCLPSIEQPQQNEECGRPLAGYTPTSTDAPPEQWDDPNPPGDRSYEDWQPDGIILNEHEYGRPSVSRVFPQVLFALLAVFVVALMAGVAVPVRGFIVDRVQGRAIKYELASVQKAVDLMMAEHGLVSLPDPGPGASGSLRKEAADATSDMSVFPYMGSGDYALLGGPSGEYLARDTEVLYYIDSTGVVHQVIPEAQ